MRLYRRHQRIKNSTDYEERGVLLTVQKGVYKNLVETIALQFDYEIRLKIVEMDYLRGRCRFLMLDMEIAEIKEIRRSMKLIDVLKERK